MPESHTQLLEELLRNPVFREQFRRDPVATAREAGLDGLANELEASEGDPMETLEPRESRSSLAGVMMAAALEGFGIYEGGHHLLPPVEAAEAAVPKGANGDGWAFVRSGQSFPGNHPNYAQLRGYGASGVLWDPDDPSAATGIASSHKAGLKAGIWLVPHQNESPQEFARRASAGITRYHPDRVVLDVESIGKGYPGSVGWQWSDDMMQSFSKLQPDPPPLAVTVEPMQDDYNYAAYTNRGAQVWPQSYLGDMTPADPQAVVDRVAANGVPRELIVPVLGPNQLEGYAGPHNIYTADDVQGRTPSPPASGVSHRGEVSNEPAAPRPAPATANGQGTAPAASPGTVDDASRAPPPAPAEIVDQAAAAEPQPAAVAAPQLSANPDDWGGDLDDEDAGADESDGSDENEPDENEPDEGTGGDSGDGSDSSDSSDGDQDAPGEGSNGEDANDPTSDGEDSSDSSSDSSDSSDSSGDGSESSSDSSSSSGAAPDLSGVDAAYPGDNASREHIAAWMASAAQKRGLPSELPVMAALTESGLRNLNYGDADSVGFFQMRTSIWDQGTYKGYGDQPQKQLQWFLDRAEAVKKVRLARGASVTDPKQYGDWVADIENPAAQYRGRYQDHYAEAHNLLAHADPKSSAGAGVADVADAAGGLSAGPKAVAALNEAKKYLGTPYLWGGSSPKTGFDCSGLVQWAYAHAGISIPRVTDQQILASNGVAVDRKHLLPGDLVFFRDSTGYVHHVGISLGGDKFLHAPHTGDVVKVSSLKESYYAQQFTGGRRFDAAHSGGSKELAASSASAPEQSSQAEAIRLAKVALEKDAAEVQSSGSALSFALERQERRNEELRNAVQFLRAVDPSLANPAA
ncbi:MAG: hypothetical protein QOE13_1390 [Gaiellaceae bacterium]|nr:hypothetical protein [Gaiellaceae bacterium]